MFTCISCQVAFIEPENQREHFQSDWHRYNLKRKVAELPPVTAESFKERVLAQKAKTEEEEDQKSIYCQSCKKVFTNKKSFENHSNSKRHLEKVRLKKERELEDKQYPSKAKKTKPDDDGDDDDDEYEDIEVEEVDSDEWEGDPIPPSSCLFCTSQNSTLEVNMKHMTGVHFFFVPDLQYCADLDGLITYLGEKVGCGMMCLWCGKHFRTVDAVQRHMRDKGHCMMKFEGETLVEYSDFFDYSSSYPDADDLGVSPDQEVEIQRLVSDGYQLMLPSGATIGHRSLFRYYKQRLKPNRSLVLHKRSTESLHGKMLAQYRALGWSGATKTDVDKRARDVKFMKRLQAKEWMKLGVKQNKLQPHFRPQVMF